jgi:hydrogenase large subunit
VATTIIIDPVTRIEGHLKIEVTVDTVGGEDQVVEARSSGTMFRGFEIILIGRDPRDAGQYTQRICGVCPVSHAMASCLNLDQAFGVTPSDNGRVLRNLVLGANFIQSHVLHFYHLSAVDYIDTTGLLDLSPWMPRYTAADMVGGTVASTLVAHYVDALEIRRKAHQLGAIFGGKLPHTGSFVVGGCTEVVTPEKITDFRNLLTEIRSFVDNVYLPDVSALAGHFPDYFQLGAGSGNLLAFGVFDLDASGTSRFFTGGRHTDGAPGAVDAAEIMEYVKYSWYADAGGSQNPTEGVTQPDPDKAGAYTWLKAPRYASRPHEVGPLARMWVNGHYTNGVSVLDRITARALEAKLIADAMDGWLNELTPGAAVYEPSAIPEQATSAGLTEAPRGALGHWMDINESVISRYQVVTPTNWNASPRDNFDEPGPIESALVGVPVNDLNQPVEVLRTVHSFDPCLACAVHMVRPDDRRGKTEVLIHPGIA